MSSPCLGTYSPFQENILSYLQWSLGSTSVLSCLSIFFGFLRMPNRPSFRDPSSMILWLTLSDLCLGVVTIAEGSSSPACSSTEAYNWCIFKACLSEFFGLSTFLWSGAMSHSSYVQVSQIFNTWGTFSSTRTTSISSREWGSGTGGAGLGDDDSGEEARCCQAIFSNCSIRSISKNQMLLYHIVCWGLPLTSTLFMLGTSSAGPSGSHLCWVATDKEYNDSILPLWIAILLYLLPLFLIECYNIYVFRFLAKTLRQIPSANSLLNRLTRYLAIVIGTKFLLLLTRATRLAVPSNIIFAIGVFSITGAPMQGIGDYLIFRDGERNSTSSAYSRSTHGNDLEGAETPMNNLSLGGGGAGGDGNSRGNGDGTKNPLHLTSSSIEIDRNGVNAIAAAGQDSNRRMSEVSLLGGNKDKDPYSPLQLNDDADGDDGL